MTNNLKTTMQSICEDDISMWDDKAKSFAESSKGFELGFLAGMQEHAPKCAYELIIEWGEYTYRIAASLSKESLQALIETAKRLEHEYNERFLRDDLDDWELSRDYPLFLLNNCPYSASFNPHDWDMFSGELADYSDLMEIRVINLIP